MLFKFTGTPKTRAEKTAKWLCWAINHGLEVALLVWIWFSIDKGEYGRAAFLILSVLSVHVSQIIAAIKGDE